MLDRPYGPEFVGPPFDEVGEYLPCAYHVQGELFLRVEIIGTDNVLYAWDSGWERWDEVLRTPLNIRLSELPDLLYVFLIQRDLGES